MEARHSLDGLARRIEKLETEVKRLKSLESHRNPTAGSYEARGRAGADAYDTRDSAAVDTLTKQVRGLTLVAEKLFDVARLQEPGIENELADDQEPSVESLLRDLGKELDALKSSLGE